MALLTYQPITTTGMTPTFAAADAAGDTIPPDNGGLLYFKNASASATTITIATPGNTKYGAAIPDVAVSVAAGGEGVIGPLPYDLGDFGDGLVHVTYSSATSLTVAALRI
jgi:hypothetical protein